jgi:hypothetical protein
MPVKAGAGMTIGNTLVYITKNTINPVLTIDMILYIYDAYCKKLPWLCYRLGAINWGTKMKNNTKLAIVFALAASLMSGSALAMGAGAGQTAGGAQPEYEAIPGNYDGHDDFAIFPLAAGWDSHVGGENSIPLTVSDVDLLCRRCVWYIDHPPPPHPVDFWFHPIDRLPPRDVQMGVGVALVAFVSDVRPYDFKPGDYRPFDAVDFRRDAAGDLPDIETGAGAGDAPVVLALERLPTVGDTGTGSTVSRSVFFDTDVKPPTLTDEQLEAMEEKMEDARDFAASDIFGSKLVELINKIAPKASVEEFVDGPYFSHLAAEWPDKDLDALAEKGNVLAGKVVFVFDTDSRDSKTPDASVPFFTSDRLTLGTAVATIAKEFVSIKPDANDHDYVHEVKELETLVPLATGEVKEFLGKLIKESSATIDTGVYVTSLSSAALP